MTSEQQHKKRPMPNYRKLNKIDNALDVVLTICVLSVIPAVMALVSFALVNNAVVAATPSLAYTIGNRTGDYITVADYGYQIVVTEARQETGAVVFRQEINTEPGVILQACGHWLYVFTNEANPTAYTFRMDGYYGCGELPIVGRPVPPEAGK
jgi:hypothetical protein